MVFGRKKVEVKKEYSGVKMEKPKKKVDKVSDEIIVCDTCKSPQIKLQVIDKPVKYCCYCGGML